MKFDALVDQVTDAARDLRELTALVEKVISARSESHVQRVVYKTEGMGTVGVICAAICALVLVFVVVEFNRQNSNLNRSATELSDRIRDLDAWRGVQANDIAALKAEVRQLKDQPKRQTP